MASEFAKQFTKAVGDGVVAEVGLAKEATRRDDSVVAKDGEFGR